ncbi:MAG: ATP-grasp domain-containing protein [Magnetococcales bacterium]|nr:acylphosphatase [Magnetococcales bacterium]NGZ05925.1 ATP-grasp domain-containing protein [Magnetococcales bacterium]
MSSLNILPDRFVTALLQFTTRSAGQNGRKILIFSSFDSDHLSVAMQDQLVPFVVASGVSTVVTHGDDLLQSLRAQMPGSIQGPHFPAGFTLESCHQMICRDEDLVLILAAGPVGNRLDFLNPANERVMIVSDEEPPITPDVSTTPNAVHILQTIMAVPNAEDQTAYKHALRQNVKQCSAIMAHEAEKLGMKVDFVTKDIYSIRSGDQEIFLFENSSVSLPIRKLTADKGVTKKLLDKKGVRVPKGKTFSSLAQGMTYFKSVSAPQVVKPLDMSWGVGVAVNLISRDEFEAAVKAALKLRSQYIVEEYFQGYDVRVLVIGGQTVAAFLRDPANVIGDGQQTIAQLVDSKNRIRNRMVYAPAIKLTDAVLAHLHMQGVDPASVPEAGTKIYLNKVANISSGGDSVVIFDHLHRSYHDLAVQAVQAFPGLEYAGVDFLIRDFTQPADENNYVIIEMNANAAITGAMFPMFGAGVNVARLYLDHYFPHREKNLNPVVPTVVPEARQCLLKPEKEVTTPPLPPQQHPSPKTDEAPQTRGRSVFASPSNARIIRSLLENHANDYAKSPYLIKQGFLPRRLLLETAKKHGFSVDKQKNTFFVFNKNKRAVFKPNAPDASVVCHAIASNKHLAKDVLAHYDIPVPLGSVFADRRKAWSYLRSRPCAQIVKPLNSYHSNGVSIDVRDEKSFKEAWDKALQFSKRIIVEDFIPGDLVRVVVLGGKVIAAVCRVPAHVVGDGVRSIADLIAIKNKKRLKNPLSKWSPILVNDLDQLEKDGRTVDEIPGVGEYVRLRSEPIITTGGEIVSIIDHLHPSILDLAIKVFNLLPGATLLGLDILVVDFAKEAQFGNACVLEVNNDPGLPTCVFPVAGPPATRLFDALLEFVEDGGYETSNRFDNNEIAVLPLPVQVNPETGPFHAARRDPWIHMKLIKQAAFQRNLMVEILTDELMVIRDDHSRRTGFDMGRPSCTRNVSRQIVRDLEWSQERLHQFNVRTPQKRKFAIRDAAHAWNFVQGLGRYVMLRPTTGLDINGIVTRFDSREHFDQVWSLVAGLGVKDAFITEYFDGMECQIFSIGNQIRAAVQRHPTSLVGDGVHSIKQLIAMKNIQVQFNALDNTKWVGFIQSILRHFETMGMDISYIPAQQEIIQLPAMINADSFRENHDVSESVHPGFAEVAAQIKKVLCDPLFFGFDLLAEDIGRPPESQRWFVTKVSMNPNVAPYHFPDRGQPRDAAGAIIEALFPEVSRTTVARKTMHVLVSGKVQGVGYRQWVVTQAYWHALNGWVRNLEDGQVEALFSGTSHAVDHMIQMCHSGPHKSQVKNVACTLSTEVVPEGFTIHE